MKLMRLAICVAAFAVVGGIAVSEDMDIKALQAKLAAQEARLNDLQAKMGSGSADTPSNIVSMRKNAKVTIGGATDTRYYYRSATLKQDNGTGMHKVADTKSGNLYMDTAKLAVQIDINENMDAFLQMDLFDGTRGYPQADNVGDGNMGFAQNYWVRWKNINCTGFGILVGKDALKFGQSKPFGSLDAWNQDGGPHDIVGVDATAHALHTPGFATRGVAGEGMFVNGNALPTHISTGSSRTVQINPYWESQDGKFKAELTLMNGIDRRGNGNESYQYIGADDDGVSIIRPINYGLGSAALRLTYKPTEDWVLSASAINLRNGYDGKFNAYRGNDRSGTMTGIEGDFFNKNNSAFNVAFKYNPAAFCQRLTVWGSFTQEYNAGWVNDLDVMNMHLGAAWAFTDKLTAFAQGDYIYADNERGTDWAKGKGWRSYVGAIYKLGNGAELEAGWAHDSLSYKNEQGFKHTKYKSDLLYAKLGFSF